jgi:hypothetical protein
MGDNLEVEQGAYGLFDTLAGNKYIETEFWHKSYPMLQCCRKGEHSWREFLIVLWHK